MHGEQKFQGIGMTSDRTRRRLIRQLSDAGINEAHVLAAMSEIPRHLFIEEGIAHRAYENNALPIGLGQTISQPYIVAQMTQILWRRGEHHKLLEIGTGSGYQSAILSRLWDEVYTIERIRQLQLTARERLLRLGLRNIHYKAADGYLGWKEHSPFDAIIVTAAAPVIPERLVAQLSENGAMIIPIGEADEVQQLILIEKSQHGIEQTQIEPVRFVPMLSGVQV